MGGTVSGDTGRSGIEGVGDEVGEVGCRRVWEVGCKRGCGRGYESGARPRLQKGMLTVT